jgi:ketosteroid isomerase-like protein
MMRAAALACLTALALVFAGPAGAEDTTDQAGIRAALAQWTEDFNARRADKICDLFESGVVADIRTQPEQNFKIVCDRLQGVLRDAARTYTYSSDIKEILVFGDVAVVRLVWTLTITGGAEGEEKSVETGMDLFRRQSDGSWKIMRWIAYN